MKKEKHIMMFNIVCIIAPYLIVTLILGKIHEANIGIVVFAVTLVALYCIFFFLIYASIKVVMYTYLDETYIQLLSFPFQKRKHYWANITEVAFNLEGRNVQNLYLRLKNGTQISYCLNLAPFASEGEVTSLIRDIAKSNNIRVIDSLSK
jgi:hypothetical protein